MLLVVKVVALCSGVIQQVNNNLKTPVANITTLHYHLNLETKIW